MKLYINSEGGLQNFIGGINQYRNSLAKDINNPTSEELAKLNEFDAEGWREMTELELQQAADLTQAKIQLETAFLSTWDNFPLYLRLNNEPIKNYVLDCINKWDIDALRVLANDNSVPAELSSFKEQLTALLPEEEE